MPETEEKITLPAWMERMVPKNWQLYTATMDCREGDEALTEGVREVARALLKFDALRDKWGSYGACDTEPRQTLARFLEKLSECYW
jgi:hypothetical protein